MVAVARGLGYTPATIVHDEPVTIGSGWHSPAIDTACRPPPGFVARAIDIASGELADDWCGPSRVEWFREGTAPTSRCSGPLFDWFEPRDPPPASAPMPPVPPVPPRPPVRGDAGLSGALGEAIWSAVEDAVVDAARDAESRATARRVLAEVRRAAERELAVGREPRGGPPR